VAAVRSDGDPKLAVKELGGALARGLALPELRGWRAHARGRAGFARPAQAEEALADLARLAAARPLTLAERRLRVRALLGAGQVGDADEQLQALGEEASLELRWAVAAAVVEDVHHDHPGQALERLKGLPAQDPPAPAREALANRVYRTADSDLARARGALSDPQKERVLTLARLGRRLWPTAPPPERFLAELLTRARGGAESLQESSLGDPWLALDVASLAPDDLEIQRKVAAMVDYHSEQRPKRALCAAVRRVIALSPDPEERQAHRVLLCVALGYLNNRYESGSRREECKEVVAVAGETLPRMAEDQDRANVLGARAVALRRLGDADGAWRDVNDALALFPAQPELHYTRMHVALLKGDADAALEEALYYADVAPESERSNQAIMQVWLQTQARKQPEVALPRLLRFLRGRPTFCGWWVRAAHLQLEIGDRDGAKASMERAVHWLEDPRERAHRELQGRLLASFRATRAAVDGAQPDAAARVRALVDQLERLRESRTPTHGGHNYLP
jgi:tetratricopeptide (TPR) repeat protein